MIASPQEIEALESFFNNIQLPHEMHLNKATKLTDVKAFVNQTLRNLKRTDVTPASLRPRYDDLLVIKAQLEASSK